LVIARAAVPEYTFQPTVIWRVLREGCEQLVYRQLPLKILMPSPSDQIRHVLVRRCPPAPKAGVARFQGRKMVNAFFVGEDRRRDGSTFAETVTPPAVSPDANLTVPDSKTRSKLHEPRSE
jgi:hypothetical protein